MQNLLEQDLELVIDATRELWEELRGENIFITGGTGFFGAWLLETFCWANARLNLNARATVLTRDPRLFRRVAPHLVSDPSLTFHVGDIRTFAPPEGTFSHVVHAATESSTNLNAEDPLLMLDTIVKGTRRCLEFAAQRGTRKFLLTSSGAVYGKQPANMERVPETYLGGPNPLDARSAYAEGKRIAELDCVLMGSAAGMDAKVARCFAFVGPYMKLDAHFAIGNFIRDQLSGGPILVKGDGTSVRSYLYAADLAIWLWTILFHGVPDRAYNVGSEDSLTTAELARQVAATLEPQVEFDVQGKPSPNAVVDRYVPSTDRACKELGLKQTITLDSAVHRTQVWFRQRMGAGFNAG